jgi:hypothetical protein
MAVECLYIYFTRKVIAVQLVAGARQIFPAEYAY